MIDYPSAGPLPATDPRQTATGRYTVAPDPDVDERIEADIERVRQAVRRACPDLVALILVGSFGRGEGQVLIHGEGAKRTIRPQNDYDFVLVTESGRLEGDLNALRAALAIEIGIDWVDLVVYSRDRLPGLGPTLFNFDLKYGSRVVDGDSGILREIPSWRPSEIPLEEAERLLFTRLWCLLGPYDLGTRDEQLSSRASSFLSRQLAKALIGIQDAQLLLIGAYDPSYRRRARRFREEFPEQQELFPILEIANREKLLPSLDAPRELGIDLGYAQVRDLVLDAFRLIGLALYRRPLSHAADYERCYFGSIARRVDRAKGSLARNPYHQRTQLVNAAQLHLLEAHAQALSLHERNQETITPGGDRARALLRQFNPRIDLPQDWNGLRHHAVEMRMAV